MKQGDRRAVIATSRPRVLGWVRSAAILDGDWGTSIAYVLGIAFTLAGHASFWHLMMMLGLTTLVALNYITICRLYPNGGGVYNSVYHRSRGLAVVGALLLAADYVITMALSVLDSCHYLGILHPELYAIVIILLIGLLNWFGPRHAGGFAMIISIATLATLGIIIIASAPHAAGAAVIAPPAGGLMKNWHIFVGIILSISGIEAISNMTGLMKDPTRDSRKAIFSVLAKVIIATVFLGLAMHAIPGLEQHTEDMVRYLGEHYVGMWFGYVVAAAIGMLLISAGNTALNGLISIQFLMAVDGELPVELRRVNAHGVPIVPLIISTLVPIFILLLVNDVIALSHLYAIGVVGAIAINIGSTATDRTVPLSRAVRAAMLVSGIVLFFIELSIIVDKPQATIFAASVLAVGLGARQAARMRRAAIERRAAEAPTEAVVTRSAAVPGPEPAYRYLVSVRGGTEHLLRVAIDDARIHNALLFVLHVQEVNVAILPERVQDQMSEVQVHMRRICEESGIRYHFISIMSYEVGYTIAEQAATLGVDRVILGSTKRSMLLKALRGSVINTVSQLLPEDVQLVIYG